MEAIRDQNHIPVKLGVLFSDGVTLVPIAINPTNGGVKVNTVDSIAFTPTGIDFQDANYVDAWMGVDSVTGLACPLFVDATGAVLINQ